MVDVPNLTLEQDILRDMMGLRRSCLAVCTAIKTRTSGTYDGGRDEWFRDNKHLLYNMNQIVMTVKFDIKSSTDLGSCKVRETANLYPKNARKALGKPRHFGQWEFCARTP